jgi:mannose-6-phosphate isomerase-like protein (cupin superfamily)
MRRLLPGLVACVAVLFAAWAQHTSRVPKTPTCTPTWRGTYVRPFGRAADFGRPGLSHVTLHGAVHHGATQLEVWQQAFAPGTQTPIHRHDCEEIFIVLSGSGMLRTRSGNLSFTANSTLRVQPKEVHQLENTHASDVLQVMVVISRPPIMVYVYDSWSTPHADAKLKFPYTWDAVCPD